MNRLLGGALVSRTLMSAAVSFMRVPHHCLHRTAPVLAATTCLFHQRPSTSIINISRQQPVLCSKDITNDRSQKMSCRMMTVSYPREGKQPVTAGRATLNSDISATTVIRTAVDQHARQLNVFWNDGEQTSYPYVWLRDSCQCSSCFHSPTASRRLLFHELDINVTPVNVEVNSPTQEIVVTWSDEHQSFFGYSWLLDRSFRFAEQSARTRWNGRTAVLWDSEMVNQLPQVEFNELLTSDKALYQWLTALEETGFVLVNGAPRNDGQIHQIAAKVAFLRRTNLGETSFEHHHNETSTDMSYMTSSQALHNDLTYYNNVPGMKMVHCINQPQTGDVQCVQFVDGFTAARQLRDRHPEQFRLLAATKLDFCSLGAEFMVLSQHPTIKLDESGEVVQINYSSRHRDTFCRLPIDQVEPTYRALRTFAGLLYDKQNLVEVKLKNDVIYCFNNWRVLHGRKSFQLVPGYEPQIERGYIDWDELHSRRRVLKSQLHIPDNEY